MDGVGEDGMRSEAVKIVLGEDDGRELIVENPVVSSFLPDSGVKVDSNGELSHKERQLVGGKVGAGTPLDSPWTSGESPEKGPGINGEATELEKDMLSSSAGSPPGATGYATGTTVLTKGRGLRKWRRIRREMSKEENAGVDSSRALKRGPPVPEGSKAHGADDHKLKSDEGEPESSVASVDDVGKLGNTSNTNSPPPVQGLDPELEMLVSGTGFAVGAVDSDHSEDRSSRSSASVSFPKHGYDGFGRERSKARSSRGRGAHIAQQKGHRGKNGLDGGKKIRGGDRAWLEKDASRSSVESDLKSWKAVITQLGSSTSNGRCSTGSVNFEKKNNSGDQADEDFQNGTFKENGEETERLTRQDLHDNGFHGAKADILEDIDCCQPYTDEYPFLNPIAMLQAAQEALEKEIEKFAEVGDDDSVTLPGNYCDIATEETEGISSHPLETRILTLGRRIEDNELKEVSGLAEAREAKNHDVEDILNRTQAHGKEMKGSNSHDLQEWCKELELELEVLFRRNLEVEIENMVEKQATQLWKVTVEDEWAFLKEQRFLSKEYDKLVLKLREAEDEAQTLRNQANELEWSCEVLERKVGLLTLQNGASKLSLCFLLQLLILCVALWLFLMQLLPQSVEDVPT